MYGIRTNPSTPLELRAAVTPRTQADHPVGEWNRFEITVRGTTVRTVLNGLVVIPAAGSPTCRPADGSPCSTTAESAWPVGRSSEPVAIQEHLHQGTAGAARATGCAVSDDSGSTLTRQSEDSLTLTVSTQWRFSWQMP